MRRTLGRSGLEVSAMGLGCWAIGGRFLMDGKADSYGDVDDAESIRAIRRAMDLGITFFDTSDAYGTGHSEEVLGAAIRGRRDDVVLATKFGYTHDTERRELTGTDTSADYIRRACAASLRRLGTDHIDLYQLHVWSIPPEQTDDLFATLDDLCEEGTIGAYGWSTGEPDNARLLGSRTRGATILHPLNVLTDAPEMLAIVAEHDLASICSGPLAMGLLSGKFTADSRVGADDVRGSGHEWVPYFDDGRPRRDLLDALDGLREILTSGGRTLAQGALAWIWARSDRTIPIPGFKTVRQAEENARAMEHGPLTSTQLADVVRCLSTVTGPPTDQS
jgi:aryl-alcohol dehydrogenase-like predicted oxidoreductase